MMKYLNFIFKIKKKTIIRYKWFIFENEKNILFFKSIKYLIQSNSSYVKKTIKISLTFFSFDIFSLLDFLLIYFLFIL
jgi:hypothetical protein